jgi:uncharacterized membrane protein YqhA
MKRIIERSVYLVLIAVIFSLLASLAAFGWGAVKTLLVIKHMVMSGGKELAISVELIAVMDTFLIATSLLILAIGMYELFIASIELPEWLVIRNLHDLKAKLSSVIILVMAVSFLERLFEWKNPQETLYLGLAVSAVAAVLIAFTRFGEKEGH